MELVVKNPPANAGTIKNTGSIPGSGRSPGRGHGNPLQYSCLEEPGGLQSLDSQLETTEWLGRACHSLSAIVSFQQKISSFWWNCMASEIFLSHSSFQHDGGTEVSQCQQFLSRWQTDSSGQFSSVQSLNCVRLFATPSTAARQASLSITNSRSPLKPVSIESVMPSNHLILCRPLLLLPPIPPSIRVFSNESALRIRWSKYWSFSFNEYPGLISFRMD